MALISIDPATGRERARFDEHPPAELDRRLERSAAAFRRWREVPAAGRAAALAGVAAALRSRREELAALAVGEMGKTISAARAELDKCARTFDWYAAHAPALVAPRPVPTEAAASRIRFDPLGPVLAVMPWNFPYWQVVRFAAPALAAGDTALLKHASNVTGCALALESVFSEAGLPDGVFQTLLAGSDTVEGLISDPRVAAVTLTGGERAGVAVGATAGRSLKKHVLELGGSDPFLVMPSADLERAVAAAVTARAVNNGQSCIAAKRFLVHAAVWDEFVERFTAAFSALRMGDPADPATELGPLATEGVRAELDRQVRETVAAGGRLLAGGAPSTGPGWFYPPTVIAEPPPASPALREELFGPVAPLVRVADLDQAIEVANSSVLGLGAAIWTREPAEAARAEAELEAGSVFVNAVVASDPRLPFGGIKRSGHGRELGEAGLLEFVNVKTVWFGAELA
jgi:succinate-semialdehyde dehydrogenase/glutarate-semialdehyde dehydrogenase